MHWFLWDRELRLEIVNGGEGFELKPKKRYESSTKVILAISEDLQNTPTKNSLSTHIIITENTVKKNKHRKHQTFQLNNPHRKGLLARKGVLKCARAEIKMKTSSKPPQVDWSQPRHTYMINICCCQI